VVTIVVDWLDSAGVRAGRLGRARAAGPRLPAPSRTWSAAEHDGEKRYTASDFALVYDGFALDSSSPAGGGFGADRCHDVW